MSARIEPLCPPPEGMDFAKALKEIGAMSAMSSMLEEIADNPESWDLYLIAADCAEDSGRAPMAACLRWLAKKRKRANPLTFCWYVESKRPFPNVDPLSDIPGTLWDKLSGDTHEMMNTHKRFSSPRAALEAVFIAWPKAIAAGWNPNA